MEGLFRVGILKEEGDCKMKSMVDIHGLSSLFEYSINSVVSAPYKKCTITWLSVSNRLHVHLTVFSLHTSKIELLSLFEERTIIYSTRWIDSF